MKHFIAKIAVIILILAVGGCGGGSSGVKSGDGGACGQTLEGACLVPTLGTGADDALVRGVHRELEAFFPYPTELYFFNEGSPVNENVYASPTDRIFFGVYMYSDLKQAGPSAYPVMVTGIMAHEYGHIMQFHIDLPEYPSARQTVNVGSTVVLSELEADAFSGLYMYFKLESEEEVNTYFAMLEALGDNGFTDPSHHGTGTQRQAAGLLGITVADYIITNHLEDEVDWADIRREFIADIENNILTAGDYQAPERTVKRKDLDSGLHSWVLQHWPR